VLHTVRHSTHWLEGWLPIPPSRVGIGPPRRRRSPHLRRRFTQLPRQALSAGSPTTELDSGPVGRGTGRIGPGDDRGRTRSRDASPPVGHETGRQASNVVLRCTLFANGIRTY
jgi:hypothetical protein